MSSSFDISNARGKFPALQQTQVYFDNAGGSQVLGSVISSISEYLSNRNVQLGASYPIGQESTNSYTTGCQAGARYINAEPDEVVFGSSTTQLFRNLSYSLKFSPGDELVISKFDHEANIASWVSIADRLGLTLKWWTIPPTSNPKLQVSDLQKLLTPKTKLVTCTHASNILGTINDIKSIARAVHSIPGALLCVDGVAYAPHRRFDVKELEVDFYSFSWYKVYGPHVSMLYASRKAQEQMSTLGHFFNPASTLENKLGLAGANYELVQAVPRILEYMGGDEPRSVNEAIAAYEQKLQKVLLDYLGEREDVTIYGERTADPKVRFPTISFGVKGRGSKGVVQAVEGVSDFGFRWGHFYSKRLCDEILQAGEEGVIRVSMVHYNTVEEIEAFVKALDGVLSK